MISFPLARPPAPGSKPESPTEVCLEHLSYTQGCTEIGNQISKEKLWRRPRLGCTPKGAYGNTAFWEGFWEGSGEGSGEGVLRRVLRRGSSMGFTVKKGSEKGSQKGFWEGGFQKLPRTPPCRVRPLRRAPYRFLPTFLASCKAKTASFSHFEAKQGKGEKQKGRPKLVALFLVEKCTFSPILSKLLWLKGRQKTRPWPKLYTPPSPPISGQKAFFRGGGWGCIFWAPTRQEFYTPPPPFFIRPPPAEGYFQGVGGVGVYKIWPRKTGPEMGSEIEKQTKTRSLDFLFFGYFPIFVPGPIVGGVRNGKPNGSRNRSRNAIKEKNKKQRLILDFLFFGYFFSDFRSGTYFGT